MEKIPYSFDIANFIPILRDFASKADYVLELGPAKGDGSTVAFEEGLLAGGKGPKLFISVDQLDYMLYKPTVDYWHLVLGDSREMSTVDKVEKIAKGRAPDLIFIDTHHTYEQMQKELEVWSLHGNKETLWLFHDTHMMGEYNRMTDAIKEHAAIYGLVFTDLRPEAHGLGALWSSEVTHL